MKAHALPRTQPFDQLAPRYDAWFDSRDGRAIFEPEVACLCDPVAGSAGFVAMDFPKDGPAAARTT
jgi:hypothetical protein